MTADKLEDDAKHQKVRTPQNVWEKLDEHYPGFPRNHSRIEDTKVSSGWKAPKISTRKLIIQKASDKELRLIQKLLTLFLRGEIAVTQHFVNRLRRTKKLKFIEENFDKIRPDPNLRTSLLKLAPLLHLFVSVVLKKNGSK